MSTLHLVIAGLLVLIAVLAAKAVYDRLQGEEGGGSDDAGQGGGTARGHDRGAVLRAAAEQVFGQAPTVRKVFDIEGRSAMALLQDEQLLVVRARWQDDDGLNLPEPTVSTRVVPAHELITAEVRETDLHRPLKGGELLERVGAVELHVFVDDLDDPVFEIGFLQGDTRPGSDRHARARHSALAWEGRVRALAHRGRRRSAIAGRVSALEQARSAPTMEDAQREIAAAREAAARRARPG